MKHARLPGVFLFLGATLILGALAGVAGAAPSESPAAGEAKAEAADTAQTGPGALLLELTDSTLIAKAWESLFPDSLPPEADFQILLPPEPAGQKEDLGGVYLLVNGTEAGRLDGGTWANLSAQTYRDGKPGWTVAADAPLEREAPLLWKAFRWDAAAWLEWARWPAGITAGLGSAVSSVPAAKPQYQRDAAFAWDQKLFRHYLIGAAAHRTQYGGGLTRQARSNEEIRGGSGTVISRSGLDFWSEASWWWSLSAGVPGLKYTLSLANQVLPRYFWLETSAASLMENRRSGKVVSQWGGTDLDRKGNLAHTLDARLGAFRYELHWDLDAYAAPVQTVALAELPALFGTWGAGLTLASDIVATRAWLDIPDLKLGLGAPAAYPSRLRVAFMRVDFAYRNLKSFSLGASVRLHIDNPILNLPGA